MRIETCSFCSAPCYPSKGITFVRNDGRAFRFCKSKCHKNFKMKRNPRKVKWTKAFRAARGKEMTVDTTLSFAARRNVPVRYNRDLVAKTLKGMDRIMEIRKKRERAFYKQRIADKRAKVLAEDRKLVEEQSHLLPPELRLTDKEIEAAQTVEEQMSKTRAAVQTKLRRKMLVGGGVEDEMDVD